MKEDRFHRAIAAIDVANAEDPNRITVRGTSRQKEQAHAELVTEWVRRLRPDASEALLLAARAHHIRRWTIPRSAYPEGRSGYLRWRRDLHELHAREAARILTAEGYEQETVKRVGEIIRKRNPTTDPEVQALEDALCLVFLETQFHDLAARVDKPRMLDVLRKTLRKMSEPAKRLALTIEMPGRERTLVEEALSS